MPPASDWPVFLMVADQEELERRLAELERLHGPRPEKHTLFVMIGLGRSGYGEPGGGPSLADQAG